jgi:hypothetical protein
MNYYFLGASLPSLSLESRPWMSYPRFREACLLHLCREDMEGLGEMERPDADSPPTHPFVRRWREREAALRNAVARIRARRLERDAKPFLRPDADRADAERAAAEAYSRPTPLERELALDRFRWVQLDELAGLTPFSSEAVLAYGMKLRLAERWAALNEETGRTLAEDIIRRPPSARGAQGDSE